MKRPDIEPLSQKQRTANIRLVMGLDKFVGELVDAREKAHPLSTLWMPQDFLPDMGTEEGRMVDFPTLQEQMDGYSDAEIAVQGLNALTEEGLPLFMSALTGERAMRSPHWRRWRNRWTAEESRHGDLITGQLAFSGRVDMRIFEQMRTSYMANDFRTGSDGDSVGFNVYTRFQEHGTQIAHRRTSRTAGRHGAGKFSRGLASIAGDEGGHKTFYGATLAEAARRDPDAVLISMRNMLRPGIVMPGARITDGEPLPPDRTESEQFRALKLAAEKTGMYTYRDYLDVVLGMKRELDVDTRTDLATSKGREAQDELGEYNEEYRDDRGSRIADIAKRREMPVFPWVRQREPNQRYVIFDSKAPKGPLPHNA